MPMPLAQSQTILKNKVQNTVYRYKAKFDKLKNYRKHLAITVYHYFMYKKKNSVALVRERTIPTERPPPVGEVSANFCG